MEKWVKVGSAPNETSALMMQGMLQGAGIPMLIQRGLGFDNPDFLSAGPRNVLVPESALEEARGVLKDTTGLGSWGPEDRMQNEQEFFRRRAARWLIGVLILILVMTLVVILPELVEAGTEFPRRH